MQTGKINLAALTHVKLEKKGKTGIVKGIFIPIQQNYLFEGKDGAVYLDIICFEMKEAKDFATHLVKQSLPKDVREKMTDTQKKEQPIIGNLNFQDQSGATATVNDAGKGQVYGDDKDLPF